MKIVDHGKNGGSILCAEIIYGALSTIYNNTDEIKINSYTGRNCEVYCFQPRNGNFVLVCEIILIGHLLTCIVRDDAHLWVARSQLYDLHDSAETKKLANVML